MRHLIRLFKSFRYAWRGLATIIYDEHNVRIQLSVAILVCLAGVFLHISVFDWIAVVLASTFVILAETINSAIERTVDLLKPRLDQQVKEIKDIMAAAVLLSSLAALAVGLLVFLPKILALILP